MDPSALWDFDDPAGSLGRFASARANAAEPAASVLATQQARALGLLNRFGEAHALLDTVSSDDDEAAVRVHLERGRVLRSAGAGDRGAADFAAAVALAEPRRDESPFGGLLVDALHMLALLEPDPAAQIDLTRAALNAADESADPAAQRWRASLLNNLGVAQHELGDDEAALASFRQAYVLREAAGQHREAQIARYMVAWGLRLLGRFDEARTDLLELRADLLADGHSDRYVVAELERCEHRSTADE